MIGQIFLYIFLKPSILTIYLKTILFLSSLVTASRPQEPLSTKFKSVHLHQEKAHQHIPLKQTTKELALKRRKPFSIETQLILDNWLQENEDNINPSRSEKNELSLRANISYSQVNEWFKYLIKKRLSPRKNQQISANKKKVLLESFEKSSYPLTDDILSLANQTELDYFTINRWFKTRRHKIKNSN